MENEVKVEEKQIITKEEALERVDDNLETIRSAFGTIKFNKIFFGVCNGVSVVAGGIGTALLIGGGLAVAPVVATGFGVAGSIYSAIQLKKQEDTMADMENAWNRNVNTREKIIEKSEKVR